MNIKEKIHKNGIREIWKIAFGYLRGLAYRPYFERCDWFQVRGRIYIYKRYAQISIGRCLIWPGVRFDLKGIDQKHPAILEIGDFTTIGDRTEIHVAKHVLIGKRCRIAWDCVILDHNYHEVDGEVEKVACVTIEDDVWLGCRVIVLPGVRIGRGAVVGAGSVVTRDVEPYCVVAGNPARLLRKIQSS